jgi:hypothetical protein
MISSFISFLQSVLVKAAAKALPRLLSNHWLDCLYTEIECRVHHVIDLDHLGPVWIAQVLKKYDDFLGSVEFRLNGRLWKVSKVTHDWYGVVRYYLTDHEGHTRTFWSEESRTADELRRLRCFSEFMEELDPDSDNMGLYTHKDILELKEILTAAREYVDDVYEPYWVTELPSRLELGLHLTQNTKPPCPTCNAFHGPASLCVLLDNNF